MNNEAIILFAIGSICNELLNIAELKKTRKHRRPDLKDFIYWLPFFIYPIISSIIAYAYFEEKEHVNKMLAIQIGASSSLIFKSLANTLPREISKESDHS